MDHCLAVAKGLELWQVLKEMGVPDHLICLLRNLYVGQEATVRTGYGTTDWFKIGKGVRQGCILSPCLFNLYAEFIMRKAGLDESLAGIKIAGRNINNLRYADDTTLMAESEEELNNFLMRVKEESAKYSLKLNIKKTKIMATGPITSWQIEGEEMEAVRDFTFLGSMITADGDSSHEIKRRLLLGRKAMTNLDSILKSRDITLPTKGCIVKAMVFPVVMYGSESWTIKKADRRRMDAFEFWCWRRLLRVPWTARRSNLSILKEISPECSLEGQILKLRLQYFSPREKRRLPGKDPDVGKDGGPKEKGTAEDEMVGQCSQSYQHEFDQTAGGSGRQECLACSGPWGHKESDMTKRQQKFWYSHHEQHPWTHGACLADGSARSPSQRCGGTRQQVPAGENERGLGILSCVSSLSPAMWPLLLTFL
uniref:Reverse transcriptase domain-containing protein n=1 Tax=Podarcis muralis TaxID=64176 RepID=A0A670KF89_PODMU